MIERLRAKWHQNISFAEIVELRDELDTMLQQIRSRRRMRPPVFKCPKCGQMSEGAQYEVSVRALILSVIRFNIAAEEPTRAIEKAWDAYRKQNSVDLYGKVIGSSSTRSGCSHPAEP
ncbi:MAG: hypothetical protein WBW33_25380 [Bryobacteraceae bacterium]